MPFMERQVNKDHWIQCDGPNGIESFPSDLVTLDLPMGTYTPDSPQWDALTQAVSMYIEGDSTALYSIEFREGWGARLSAPGYMDCTPWTIYDSEAEAEAGLTDTYGEEEEEEEEFTES